MKSLALVFFTLVLGACASTQNMAVSPGALHKMHGKSLLLVRHESPDFVAMTSGKGMFAVVGVAAAVSEGNKMVKGNDIADPATAIGRELGGLIASSHGVALQRNSAVAKTDEIDSIVALARGSDYALDVATNGWGYIYDGFNFGDYFVGYSSKLRLIDVSSGEVVASGFCAYDAKRAGKAPVPHARLIAENGAYIKQELADAADLCIRNFSAKVLSTTS